MNYATTATNAALRAAGEIPNYYEPGWAWWAFVAAGVGLVFAGFCMAYGVPILVEMTKHRAESSYGWVIMTVLALGLIGAVFYGWSLPGELMRHTATAGGAFWYFVGSFLAGLTTWGLSWWVMDDMKAWPFALPAVVICAGSVVHGIAEILTRTAASIPTSVGQLSGIVALGAVGVVVYMLGNRR